MIVVGTGRYVGQEASPLIGGIRWLPDIGTPRRRQPLSVSHELGPDGFHRLLLLRQPQEEFHDPRAVSMEMRLQIQDGPVPRAPDLNRSR